MEVIKTIEQLRARLGEKRRQGKSIGLVPTMGYLHAGHLCLVAAAKKDNDIVVMSIFVNPLQFGPAEDFSTYPRDFANDSFMASEAGVDIIFNPEVEEMYPVYPQLTTVVVGEITRGLCGASRPGHFTGVTTVVSKLLNIVQPDKAYFGQKDYQQVQVIKRMVGDLNMPIEIITVPIKREADGLAMSSRNTYLAKTERKEALCLHEALSICAAAYEKGEHNCKELKKIIDRRIRLEASAEIDYIEICDANTLLPVDEIEGQAVVALAIKVGRTRLIDNILIGGI